MCVFFCVCICGQQDQSPTEIFFTPLRRCLTEIPLCVCVRALQYPLRHIDSVAQKPQPPSHATRMGQHLHIPPHKQHTLAIQKRERKAKITNILRPIPSTYRAASPFVAIERMPASTPAYHKVNRERRPRSPRNRLFFWKPYMFVRYVLLSLSAHTRMCVCVCVCIVVLG